LNNLNKYREKILDKDMPKKIVEDLIFILEKVSKHSKSGKVIKFK